MTVQLDHVALAVADLDGSLALFRSLFGMEVEKTAGAAPERKVWLRQGIQLNEAPAGAVDHIALRTDDLPALLRQAQAHGLTPVPGKQNWLTLPNGTIVELLEK